MVPTESRTEETPGTIVFPEVAPPGVHQAASEPAVKLNSSADAVK